MIKATSAQNRGRAPTINPQRGEFQAMIDGEMLSFDTRLATIAAMEDACGDRPIVDVLNGIIAGRRAKDQIPLIAAALDMAEPEGADPLGRAARVSVGEAEAFILALVFALGFNVTNAGTTPGGRDPLDGTSAGSAGENSRSAA